jgi:hypothetical protein
MKADDDRPVVDTLIVPPRHVSPRARDAYYLRLADIALGRAQEEQARIKEQIRPHVERYNQITGNKTRLNKAG